MNPAFTDFLRALLEEEARFPVVGAHAIAVHGIPVGARDVRDSDQLVADLVLQLGVPPRRIDLLTGVSGLEFASAWGGRVLHRVESLDVLFIGRTDLVRNRRAAGRLRDLGDVEALGEGLRDG